jgi:hypothetical protein
MEISEEQQMELKNAKKKIKSINRCDRIPSIGMYH